MIPLGLDAKPIRFPYMTLGISLFLVFAHIERSIKLDSYKSEIHVLQNKYDYYGVLAKVKRVECLKLVKHANESPMKEASSKNSKSSPKKESKDTEKSPKLSMKSKLSQKELGDICGPKLKRFFWGVYASSSGKDLKERSEGAFAVSEFQVKAKLRRSDISKLFENRQKDVSEYLEKAPRKTRENLRKMSSLGIQKQKDYGLASVDHRNLYASFLASVTHSGRVHLFGNLLAFVPASIFLELKLGMLAYSLFTLTGAIIIPYASVFLMSFIGTPTALISSVLVGFSGSVSACWGAYWILFRRRVTRFFVFFFVPVVVSLPSAFAIPLFLVLSDVDLAFDAVASGKRSGVSFEAHLTGFCFGVWFAYIGLLLGFLDRRYLSGEEKNLLKKISSVESEEELLGLSANLRAANPKSLQGATLTVEKLGWIWSSKEKFHYSDLTKHESREFQMELSRLLRLAVTENRLEVITKSLRYYPPGVPFYRLTGTLDQRSLIKLMTHFWKGENYRVWNIFALAYLVKYGSSKRNRSYLLHCYSWIQKNPTLAMGVRNDLLHLKDDPRILEAQKVFQTESEKSGSKLASKIRFEMYEDGKILPLATDLQKVACILIDFMIISTVCASFFRYTQGIAELVKQEWYGSATFVLVPLTVFALYYIFYVPLSFSDGSPGMKAVGIRIASVDQAKKDKARYHKRFLLSLAIWSAFFGAFFLAFSFLFVVPLLGPFMGVGLIIFSPFIVFIGFKYIPKLLTEWTGTEYIRYRSPKELFRLGAGR